MVPFLRNQNFIGRESELLFLEKQLDCSGDFSRQATICGLGGVG